jgi:G3E family GTPase
MARAKRASDEQYNARRRAKRALARISKSGKNLNKKEYSKVAKQVEALNNLINNSYFSKKLQGYQANHKEISKVESKLESTNFYKSIININRKRYREPKELTQAQNNRLSNMQEEHFHRNGEMSRWEQSQFYSYTQFIWEGTSASQRNNAIIDYLNDHGAMVKEHGREVEVTNLKYAFDFVKAQHKEEWEMKRKANKLRRIKRSFWTEEDANFMNEVEQIPTSPLPDNDQSYGF